MDTRLHENEWYTRSIVAASYEHGPFFGPRECVDASGVSCGFTPEDIDAV